MEEGIEGQRETCPRPAARPRCLRLMHCHPHSTGFHECGVQSLLQPLNNRTGTRQQGGCCLEPQAVRWGRYLPRMFSRAWGVPKGQCQPQDRHLLGPPIILRDVRNGTAGTN